MKTRRFHRLESELSGLDIFRNWAKSSKNPIRDTDLSVIYNGKEYEDKAVDYIAIGKALIPCLTKENLLDIVRSMDEDELKEFRTLLGF
jgi:hypothetical protein